MKQKKSFEKLTPSEIHEFVEKLDLRVRLKAMLKCQGKNKIHSEFYEEGAHDGILIFIDLINEMKYEVI